MSALALLVLVALAQAPREIAVGMPARFEEVVLPGPELAPLPADVASKGVLRVLDASPHGTAFRYDLEFVGLEPGDYDLRDFLVRKDGEAKAADLPALPVRVKSALPAGQVLPHPLDARATPRLGGYRTLLIVAGVLWLAGLGALLFWRRRRGAPAESDAAKPKSLAERLKPLVERAIAGSLPSAQCAELEMSLVALWQKRLGLESREPADVLRELRSHAEAGPLLVGLETWLHRPPRTGERVDLAELLAPYWNLPPDAIDVTVAKA